MTTEEARQLGELHGLFRQADSRLAEWPTLSDEKVVAAAEAYLSTRKAFQNEVKRLGKEMAL